MSTWLPKVRNYRDCRYTFNPHNIYVHITGYVLRHEDSPHFLWGKHLQCMLFILILKPMLTPRIQTPQPKSLWWELISRSCLCAWISLWRTFATTLCKHAKSIPESCTYEYRISSMYDLLFCFTSGIWSGICKHQKYLWLWFGRSWQLFRFLRPHLTYNWFFFCKCLI